LKKFDQNFFPLTKAVTSCESFDPAFSFGKRGAKEKAWQKEKRRSEEFRSLRRARRAARPPPRKLLKKFDQNFYPTDESRLFYLQFEGERD